MSPVSFKKTNGPVLEQVKYIYLYIYLFTFLIITQEPLVRLAPHLWPYPSYILLPPYTLRHHPSLLFIHEYLYIRIY